MAASSSRQINFKVRHHRDSTNGQSKTKRFDIHVVVPEKYKIDEVVFHRYGSLLAGPLYTAKKVRFEINSKGKTCVRYSFEGYSHPHRSDESSSVILKLVDSFGLITQLLYEVGEDEAGNKYTAIRQAEMKKPSTYWKRQKTIPPLSSSLTFGVELELSEDRGTSPNEVKKTIQGNAGVAVKVVGDYSDAHTQLLTWKLVPDGSIQCSRSTPGCSKFELVSPILCGEKGLVNCRSVLQALRTSNGTKIRVNKSMGFHVHVSVKGFSLDQLKRICQNYIKYEDAMDMFMPKSRRTGGSACDAYFKSCKATIRNHSGTIAKLNGGRHRAIEACDTIRELCELMNPDGRYYKLNLQNLVTGRQPTIEFRQHSATANADKVLAWVRFCVVFVANSAFRPAPISYLRNDADVDEQVEHLFEDLIQNRTLENFYVDRMLELESIGISSTPQQPRRRSCCTGCAHGRSCRSHHQSNSLVRRMEQMHL